MNSHVFMWSSVFLSCTKTAGNAKLEAKTNFRLLYVSINQDKLRQMGRLVPSDLIRFWHFILKLPPAGQNLELWADACGYSKAAHPIRSLAHKLFSCPLVSVLLYEFQTHLVQHREESLQHQYLLVLLKCGWIQNIYTIICVG